MTIANSVELQVYIVTCTLTLNYTEESFERNPVLPEISDIKCYKLVCTTFSNIRPSSLLIVFVLGTSG